MYCIIYHCKQTVVIQTTRPRITLALNQIKCDQNYTWSCSLCNQSACSVYPPTIQLRAFDSNLIKTAIPPLELIGLTILVLKHSCCIVHEFSDVHSTHGCTRPLHEKCVMVIPGGGGGGGGVSQ